MDTFGGWKLKRNEEIAVGGDKERRWEVIITGRVIRECERDVGETEKERNKVDK